MRMRHPEQCRCPFLGSALLTAFLVIAGGSPLVAQVAASLPHLHKQGSATQLIVHNAPFLMLGGELGNSSASDPQFMAAVWPKLKGMGLNTVLMPVYWELIEPAEGSFDFSLVDSLIAGARAQDLKIVVLWFGTWKNSMSCYAPLWVKTNQDRFPRARTKDGRPVEILTPFSDENRDADIHAFSAFMKHLRTVDAEKNTVVMIQVENEIGMIPEARDHSAEAERAFARPVPPELMASLQKRTTSLTDELQRAWNNTDMKTSGTWEEVFGKGIATDEIFMAWHFARYTNAVAEAGKKEYPLPMYVNAALIRPKYRPGQYPSAGPLPHLMDVWKAAAPHIDLFAPDVYFPNFAEWISKFDRNGNAMFVPEVDRHQSATNAFFAFGRHNAMGYSPFSIESVDDPGHSQFRKAYNVLHQLTPLILAHQGDGTMTGVLLDSAAQTAEFRLGDYIFTVKHESTWPYAPQVTGETPRYGGLMIMAAKDEFFIAGSGILVTFRPGSDDPHEAAGIGSIDEGVFRGGKWVPGRRLNGDEDHQGRHVWLPAAEYGIQHVKLYTYK